MKCLFVNAIKNADWGGMENWMLKLCTSLPQFGDECLVVGRPSSRWPAISSEHRIAFEPCTFGGDLAPWVVPRLRAICQNFQPDVAIVKGFRQARFMRFACPSAAIAVKLPMKYELTPALTDRLTFHFCVDRVLTDSVDTRHTFLEFPWVLPGKIAAVHNGVSVPDAAELPESRIRLREFMNVPSDTLIVGASGRLTAPKAFDDAIKAFAGLHRKEAHMIIFGSGPEQASLKRLGAQLGIASRIHFPGWHDDARRLLWGCDAFIHPSLFEGLPNTVLESMAGGVPVVATRVGGTAELFAGPMGNFLAEPHDVERMTAHLNRLMKSAGLRLETGRLVREHVQAFFSIPVMTCGIRKVLLDAMALRLTLHAKPKSAPEGLQWITDHDHGIGPEARLWPDLALAREVSRSGKATVHHVDLEGRSYFTKQFTGDRWMLRRIGLRRPVALNNFRAARQIALLGARTVPHVAAGWTSSLDGRANSLLITEAIPGFVTADQWANTHPSTSALRRSFVDNLAGWLARLHAAGIAPHDLKFSNILVGQRQASYEFVLLDLDNCRFHFPGVTSYEARRNLHQLFRSFQKVMTTREALRFMAVYRRSRHLPRRKARRLFDAVERRLRRHGHGFRHLRN